jgi:plastocyanin
MANLRCASTCAGICALAALALGGPAASQTPSRVTIDNFTFKPAALTVRAGTAVTFTNGDDIPHSVVSDNGSFRSKALDTGDTFTFTFKTPGDFGYFCGLHPHMTGHVVVIP